MLVLDVTGHKTIFFSAAYVVVMLLLMLSPSIYILITSHKSSNQDNRNFKVIWHSQNIINSNSIFYRIGPAPRYINCDNNDNFINTLLRLHSPPSPEPV